MTIPHDEQPKVLTVWPMPPFGPDWEACYSVEEMPLGVALSCELRGWCIRVGEWPTV